MCSGGGPGHRPRSCARDAAFGRPFSLLPSLAGLDLLLARDRALGTAPAPRVGARALPADREAAAVAHAAAGTELGQALDVRRDVAPEVALDEDLLSPSHTVHDLPQAGNLLP